MERCSVVGMNKEIKSYKLLDVNFPPNPPIKNAKLYVLNSSTDRVEAYITNKDGVPKPLKDEAGGGEGTYTFTSSDGSVTISGTNNINLILESSLKSLINSALQSGDNISELNNNLGYITIGDIPTFDPSNYDLNEFTNINADPFARISDLISGGATQLSELTDVNTSTPTNRNVLIANGVEWESRGLTEADISDLGVYLTTETDPIFTASEAFNINASDINNLSNLSGINTGDQTSIVGITGTKAEFNNALTNGDFLFIGDTPTAHTHTWNDITSTPTTLVGYGITDAYPLVGNPSGFLTNFTELNDLSSNVTWVNVPDANITESSVIQHEGALTITESQISDLSHFTPTDLLTDYGITLSTVAISNDYNDLDNLPIIPSAYTDEQAQDAIATAIAAGTSTRISIGYVDGSNLFNFTVDDDLSSYDNSTTQFISVGNNISDLINDAGYLNSIPSEEEVIGTTGENLTLSGAENISLGTNVDMYLKLTGNTIITFTDTPSTGESITRTYSIESDTTETLTIANSDDEFGTYEADGTRQEMVVKASNYSTQGLIIKVFFSQPN